ATTGIPIRARPGADHPPRKELTRPIDWRSVCGGREILTSGSSTTTRLGLGSAETLKSTGRSRPITNRVRSGVSSIGVAEATCRGASAGSVADAGAPTAPNPSNRAATQSTELFAHRQTAADAPSLAIIALKHPVL